MDINVTKKPLPDYSFAILWCRWGTPAHKLTTATMAGNTDSSKESDVSIDIQYFSHYQRKTKQSQKKKVSCHQIAEHKSCDMWMTIQFSIFAGVNMHGLFYAFLHHQETEREQHPDFQTNSVKTD
ncbi:hypothetical protein ILYODFUR_010320 [Ilyodon furcidens]|uniref:Uncharacterized protein n=1 Tax=Ilyodon furcidens TaxID=33524 RepID=A0ABV0V202_9TELE